MIIKVNDNKNVLVVLYVRLTRQYFFFLYKYYKCLKLKIKTLQLTFIKTNQPKIHKYKHLK